jgi:hypothetical protein
MPTDAGVAAGSGWARVGAADMQVTNVSKIR